jgi:hypothetical protein
MRCTYKQWPVPAGEVVTIWLEITGQHSNRGCTWGMFYSVRIFGKEDRPASADLRT